MASSCLRIAATAAVTVALCARRFLLLRLRGFEQAPLRLRHPLGRAVRAHEYRLHPVVVGLRDRVVLVAVTLRAFDGQPERRGGDDFQGVFEGLIVVAGGVLDVDEIRSAGVGSAAEIASRRQRFDHLGGQLLLCAIGVPVIDQFVAGNLFLQKAIVGLVLVERADDVVAIAPGVRTNMVGVEDAFRVGVAGEVEPVSAPTFAIAFAGEQAVDHAFVCVGRAIGDELGHFAR